MKIFNSPIITKKYKRSAIAIGNFDGVHKGHQKVFTQAKKFAKKNKIKFGILTFTPLPVMFFNKKVSNYRIASEHQKFKLFKKNGVDFLVNIKFNKNFSRINAFKFIKNIIYKKINPKLIFVSNNFKFGNKRKGNVSQLKKFGKKLNVISEPKEIKQKEIIENYNNKFKVIPKNMSKYFGEKILKLSNLSIVDLTYNELEFLQLKGLLDEELIKPLYLS